MTADLTAKEQLDAAYALIGDVQKNALVALLAECQLFTAAFETALEVMPPATIPSPVSSTLAMFKGQISNMTPSLTMLIAQFSPPAPIVTASTTA